METLVHPRAPPIDCKIRSVIDSILQESVRPPTMIVALLSDPFLRATVQKGALPDEDVFWTPDDVRLALEQGYPRLGIHASEDPHPLGDPRRIVPGEVPLVALTRPTLRAWESARRSDGFAVSRIDDHGRRLRGLMQAKGASLPWVERIFRDLGRAAGVGLPRPLRGFGRRILELPAGYEDLHAMADLTGLTRGALKARFRRRDLPSPYTYLRWFRVLAASHVLSDPDTTTEEAAFRLGLHSSGNFCRFVQEVSGLAPSEIRDSVGRTRLIAAFVRECLTKEQVEGWKSLDDLFLAGAA